MNAIIKEKLAALPYLPGCYLMKNISGEIIYVGKAKELHNRVSSYFTLVHSGKTAKLVEEIHDFDIIITSTEAEALLLEINLIHLHFPKYNIMLKDDKSYPYILYNQDPYPSLKIIRNYHKKMGKAFGPFPNSGAAYRIVALLNQLYPLRKCRHIPKKECLYYHIRQCLGPCIKEISKEEIDNIREEINNFFAGKVGKIREDITKRMYQEAEELRYEEAGKKKNLLLAIDEVLAHQKIDFNEAIDIDVIAYQVKNEYLSVVILIYRSGTLVGKRGEVIALYDDYQDALTSFLLQYYQTNPPPREIVISDYRDQKIIGEVLKSRITIPEKGRRKEILALAGQNAIKNMEDHFIYASAFTNDTRLDLLNELGGLLNIRAPRRIELFDASHLQGSEAVAAMVVFINCQANKKLYRKYRLSTESAGNDYNSMKEVIRRRLARMIEEKSEEPDLILVDGGQIQVNAALSIIEDLGLDINVAGLVKGKGHKTRGILNKEGTLLEIDSHSSLFHFLTRMQDEVHRFAISYFRNSKNKSLTASALDNIPGLGKKRRDALLKAFGTVSAIKAADIKELSQYVPNEVAQNILDALKND